MNFLNFLISPEIISMIVGGFLVAFFSLRMGLSKEKTTPKYFIWGIFFSGLIVVISGILAGYEEQKTSEQLQSKTDKIVKLAEKNDSLTKVNTELIQRNEAALTGGDSYVYLMPFIPVGSDMIEFHIVHSGEYPLYDVYINIIDQTKLKSPELAQLNINNFNRKGIDPLQKIQQSKLSFRKAVINLDIGNLSPYFTKEFGPYRITGAESENKTQQYLVQIMARNGSISQIIKAVKIKGNWKYSWEVSKNDGKVLAERKVPEVPLD